MAIIADYKDSHGVHIIIDNQYSRCSPEEQARRLEVLNSACIAVLEAAAKNEKKQAECKQEQ